MGNGVSHRHLNPICTLLSDSANAFQAGQVRLHYVLDSVVHLSTVSQQHEGHCLAEQVASRYKTLECTKVVVQYAAKLVYFSNLHQVNS